MYHALGMYICICVYIYTYLRIYILVYVLALSLTRILEKNKNAISMHNTTMVQKIHIYISIRPTTQ